MKKKILIDTDIGGDIDDALALALALNSPELEIVGISTVYLGIPWRTNLTKNMLKVFGRGEIPVAMGAGKPLNGWWDASRIPDSGKSFSTDLVTGQKIPCACDFIIEQCEKYGGELTVVAIGPLTNLGLALAKAPHIAQGMDILLMGGQVTKAHPEWNILCDPEAARIVLESGANVRMVGLDVTNRCTFTLEDIERIRSVGNPRTDLLAEMLDKFLREFPFLPVLHDPLALSALLWDDLLTWSDKRILIETAGVYSRGITIDCDWEEGVNARVAVDVRPEEFKERLLERITR